MTPLHLAASKPGSAEVVAELLNAGGDPNALDHSGRSPLKIAVVRDRSLSVERALLAGGATPNIGAGTDGLPGEKLTPTHIISREGVEAERALSEEYTTLKPIPETLRGLQIVRPVHP